MKKNLLLILVAMLFGTSMAFSQYVSGTDPDGGNSNRGVVANGLTELFSVSGNYTLSADGAGNQYGPYSVDINKPSAGATVNKAYLMGVSTGFSSYSIPDGCITLNGVPINWNASVASSIYSWNHYADVTEMISGIMNPPMEETAAASDPDTAPKSMQVRVFT